MASGIAERSLRNVSLRCAVLAIVAVLLIVLTLGVQREEAQVAEPQNSVYAGSAPGTTPWNESKSVSHKAWNSNEYPGAKAVNVASGVEKAKVLNGRQGSTGLPFAEPAFCGYRLEYRESQWERFWHENIGDLQSADSVWKDACEYMTKWDSSKVKEYEWMWQRRQQWTLEELMAEQWDKSIFSYHEMVDGCTGDVTMRIPIEPLVGALRHPAYPCFRRNRDALLDKNWIFTTYDFEFAPHGFGFRKYLFDLGASLYDSGAGGASQHWFIDTYKARGIQFDRVLGWEVTKHDDPVIYRGMPPDVVDAMSYFNMPAETAADAKHNPLRTLKAIARREDFVVIKIDIDHSPTELALVQQILAEPEISNLIDELYFEHHVMQSPLNACCWGYNNQGDVASSYDLFANLRKLGIRAHSWV